MIRPLLAPVLLALGTLALAGALVHSARHPGVLGTPAYGQSRVEGARFPKVLVTGARHDPLPRPPARIASLTTAADEILADLVDSSRLAAVTHFADEPAITTAAGRFPKHVARIRGSDPERVIALTPDLVPVAHYTLESAVRILSGAGIPVVRLGQVRSFADVDQNVRLLAAATGDEAAGEAMLARMHETLGAVAERVRGRPEPRVLYYSAVGFTTGKDTLIDEKIRRAGGANAAADAGLVGLKSVALDLLVSLDPDVIVVPGWTSDAAAPVRELAAQPAFRGSRAVLTGRVHSLPASVLTAESPDGVRGVEELARLLHPEAFSS